MGYTHYWYRPREIPAEKFNAILSDFEKTLSSLRLAGVALAGPLGTGEPEFTSELIAFNGQQHCDHAQSDHGIQWPAPSGAHINTQVVGTWFAGALLQRRSCDGDCSHESFYFQREIADREPMGPILYYKQDGSPEYNEPNVVGKYFDFCKTAFKPYDLAVNVALIVAKHHLGNDLSVSSDGGLANWLDAVLLCANVLGYDPKAKILD